MIDRRNLKTFLDLKEGRAAEKIAESPQKYTIEVCLPNIDPKFDLNSCHLLLN
jgi:hypothetical protein